MQPPQQSERELVHAIILSPRGSEVLLKKTDEGLVLPSVEIPRWERVAENLTATLKREWGCDAICLFTPKGRPVNLGSDCNHYEVMQCWQDAERTPEAAWFPLLSLAINSFGDMEQFQRIADGLQELESYERDLSAPFAKRGGLLELRKWIADVVGRLGLEPTDQFQQFNAGPTFSLIRFETDGPAVWFKAVGEPNLREFPLMLKLTELFPKFMPEILGTRREWNSWLSREVVGTNLGKARDVVLWQRAAADLANLQIESTSNCDSLLQAGAHDLRFDVLISAIEPFFELAARLMHEQPKVPPAILSPEDLSLVRMLVDDALTMLEDLGIPDTLGHLDLNPCNIILSANGSVFLDWAEACVGHPFFSLEYLFQHSRREVGSNATVQREIAEAYIRPWRQVHPDNRINEALALVPLPAVFAYAVGTETWKDEERLRDPNLAGYFRALARRMNREAAHFLERRSPCLN